MPTPGRESVAGLLVAALVASAAPAARAAAPPTAPDLPDHYAPLFEPGRVWRWTIEEATTTHDYDPDTDTTTTETQASSELLRCQVGEVTPRSGALVSTITCDGDVGSHAPRLAGTWAATREGLWQLDAGDAAGSSGVTKRHGRPLLTPRQKAQSWRVDASCGFAVAAKELEVYGGLSTRGWCVTETCEPPGGGDAAWHTTCFAPEVGALTCRYETSHGAFDVTSEGAAHDPLPDAIVSWAAPPAAGDQAAVTAAVERWVAAQNGRDFAAYAASYGDAFEGVKRTSRGRTTRYTRARWLEDRRRMFEGGGQQVVARDARVEVSAATATVSFTQLWRSPTYADRGTKALQLARGADGVWQLTREEMQTSERWHGQLGR